MIHVNVNVKIIKKKKDYSLNPCTFIYENNKYLKRVSDDSVILCGERHG